MVLSGVPLSGKTTLARAIVDRVDAGIVHVENDAVRRRVVEAMGHDEPTFEGRENHATYRTSYALIERALEAGMHAIHDATNLSSSTRSDAYDLADGLGVDVGVVFLVGEPSVLEARAQAADPAGRRAFRALGDREPTPGVCSRAHLVLDAGQDVQANLARVLEHPSFAVLSEGAGPVDAGPETS